MKRLIGAFVFSLGFFCNVCAAQTAATAPATGCSVESPALIKASANNNIFDERQEQDLGDALAEEFESDMHIAPAGPNDELTRIGDRLLATLPATGIKYRFRIYDSGEINGFSLAGGRVYISRKLITAVKNEDQLAGVLAHEIGHLYMHQVAIEMTRSFRIRLGITSVTDRANIFATIHKFFSTPAKPEEEEQGEVKEEVLADRVAIYAMVRAGYAPESFTSFFDQVSMNKGKTGNWFSDFFGLTHDETKRFREAREVVEAPPAPCRAKQPTESSEFASWLRATVEERIKTETVGLEKDKPLKLENPIQPSLWRIRFSPDGSYLLAQDEGSIAVIDHPSGQTLFRIDAPNVDGAQFTPDSKNIVFHDSNLRVETWNVPSATRTSVKELVVYGGCDQTLLTPDGKTFLCINLKWVDNSALVGVRLIDVETGKPFLDKPAFFEASMIQGYDLINLASNVNNGYNIADVAVSPDGRYLILSDSSSVLAYDLHSRQFVPLGGKLKGLAQRRMTFIAPDRLLLLGELKGNRLYQFRILSFPDGQLIKEGEIGNQQFESATDGKFLTVWPLKDDHIGILDIETNKLLWASKLQSLDAWGGLAAGENGSGGVDLTNLADGKLVQRIPLPLTSLPALANGDFSSDGKYLAVSLRNRAGIWNLETGNLMALIRPFKNTWIDNDDHLFVQFPKFLELESREDQFDLVKHTIKELGKPDQDAFQYRDLELRLKPMSGGKSTATHVTLEVKKMTTQAVLWTKDFPHEKPAIWSAEDDRMVLAWDMGSDWAKEEVKSHPNLQVQAAALAGKRKGLLIETFTPETGVPLEQTVVPEADLTHGLDDIRRAFVSGKFVVARGEHGNTCIYRLETGAKVAEFFGSAVAVNSDANLIAAVNRDDEIVLVEETTGKELKRFSLGSPVRATRIITGQNNMLLVFTADQMVHRLPLPDGSIVAGVAAAQTKD